MRRKAGGEGGGGREEEDTDEAADELAATANAIECECIHRADVSAQTVVRHPLVRNVYIHRCMVTEMS